MSKYAEIQSLVPLINQGQAESKLRHWGELARICRYLFTLENEDLDLIRYHSWQLTGDIYPTYMVGNSALRSDLLAEYESCTTALADFRPAEAEDGVGFDTEYGKISIDLVRYLRALNDLVRLQIISRTKPLKVFELGGGYGGLARLVLMFNPNTTYVICDQEIVLYFAGIYLTHALGKNKVKVVQEANFTIEPGKIFLVPEIFFEACRSLQFDLAISQQSLQEMTRGEVERYCAFFKENTKYLYSCNSQVPPGPEFIQDLTDYLIASFKSVWLSESITNRTPRNHWLKSLLKKLVHPEILDKIRGIRHVLRKKKNASQYMKEKTEGFTDRLLLLTGLVFIEQAPEE